MKWILHHYDFSNFSEKIRAILGYKNIAWRSVEIPERLPKPDYLPLTGGYRRTPALQLGADIYCDTRLIAEVLEAATPQPSLFPDGARSRALSYALAQWSETRLIWPAALYITGINADRYPQEFHRDRAVLHGKPIPDVARVKASAKKYLAQLRSELALIEALFIDGQCFVFGALPSLADFSLYHVPWFLDTIDREHGLLDSAPRTRAWMEKIAAFGHGDITTVGGDEAIACANESIPLAVATSTYIAPEGIAIGEAVSVSPLDENSPAQGELVYVDDQRISIAASDERIARVHIHFPRSGYRLSRVRKTE